MSLNEKKGTLQEIRKVDPPVMECILPKDYTPGTLTNIEAARIAGEAHRRVRYNIQNIIQPGMSMLEIAEIIENGTRTVLGAGYNKGIGFPTGLSLNTCAAHDTPNPKTPKVILQENDVLKVDFGTHIDGYIIDSAFTVAFNESHNELLKAARESVYECLKIAGPDTRLKDIGEMAEEIIRSYEIVNTNGNATAIRPVSNLNGHSIDRYKIHGGKYVPIVKRSGNKDKMVEGEFYAIETFTTTGNGYVIEKEDCSHYMLVNKKINSPLEGGKNLLKYLDETFSTLPFCKRYISPTIKASDAYLSHLCKIQAVEMYPPLYDTQNNSLVAQFEHTLFIKDTGIEVVSKGEDY
ncbi:methionyl aminopeptidase [Nematocida sp. AWRm80]|nr:methionyl aminopeptidase [Nematocida sp. AWRm80]